MSAESFSGRRRNVASGVARVDMHHDILMATISPVAKRFPAKASIKTFRFGGKEINRLKSLRRSMLHDMVDQSCAYPAASPARRHEYISQQRRQFTVGDGKRQQTGRSDQNPTGQSDKSNRQPILLRRFRQPAATRNHQLGRRQIFEFGVQPCCQRRNQVRMIGQVGDADE